MPALILSCVERVGVSNIPAVCLRDAPLLVHAGHAKSVAGFQALASALNAAGLALVVRATATPPPRRAGSLSAAPSCDVRLHSYFVLLPGLEGATAAGAAGLMLMALTAAEDVLPLSPAALDVSGAPALVACDVEQAARAAVAGALAQLPEVATYDPLKHRSNSVLVHVESTRHGMGNY